MPEIKISGGSLPTARGILGTLLKSRWAFSWKVWVGYGSRQGGRGSTHYKLHNIRIIGIIQLNTHQVEYDDIFVAGDPVINPQLVDYTRRRLMLYLFLNKILRSIYQVFQR